MSGLKNSAERVNNGQMIEGWIAGRAVLAVVQRAETAPSRLPTTEVYRIKACLYGQFFCVL